MAGFGLKLMEINSTCFPGARFVGGSKQNSKMIAKLEMF